MSLVIKNKSGLVINPSLQEGLVTTRGSDLIHEMAVSCPTCRTADVFANTAQDGQYAVRSPNCIKCGGDGRLYRKPALVRGIVSGMRQNRIHNAIGDTQPGDMQLSIGPGFPIFGAEQRRISRDDKFTATWDSPLDDGQTVVRGAATLDDNLRLKFAVNADEDRLWYYPAKALHCEDENGIEYFQDADFVLGEGKIIKWIGNQPDIGTKYVIKYTAYLEWIVWIPPTERTDVDGVDLGPLVQLRRKHVAFVNDSPYIVEEDRVFVTNKLTATARIGV